MQTLLGALEGRLSRGAVLPATAQEERYRRDGSRRIGAEPSLILRPRTTEEVSTILAACNALRHAVVVQGGRTGLVGGARPRPGEIVLSLERMTGLEPVDCLSATVLVEAGVALQAVQDAATAADLYFGVDIGARGSATVGGNIATNAGGIRVLRYGMFRAQVRGLEAVLADGTVLSSLGGLIKDNSGYDLKQLFIGSEGTLGVVTRAKLALHPAPAVEQVALCAVDSVAAAQALLGRLRGALGHRLSAFEAIWGALYDGMSRHGDAPVARGAALYLMIETQDQAAAAGETSWLEAAMASACEAGLCRDIVVSQSPGEWRKIWRLRDRCSEFVYGLKQPVGHDVSLPQARMADFIADAERQVRTLDAGADIFIFGHLGDGNVHYIVDTAQPDAVSRAVYGAAAGCGGSISAEHGIGLDKKPYLSLVRGAGEFAVMRRLKQALDPNHILNPGRIFDMAAGSRS